jgi:hypothetical protein
MNEYTDSSGVRYVARPAPEDIWHCTKCAHRTNMGACMDSPACTKGEREDGQYINWVRADKE